MLFKLSFLLPILPLLLAAPTVDSDVAVENRLLAERLVPAVEDPSKRDTVPIENVSGGLNDVAILSGCNQGDCPDHGATVDFLKEAPIILTKYAIRVNDCGQCLRLSVSNDGCTNFR